MPDETPTFAVAIAAHQAAETVADAVRSVLEQTMPANEIIVCDDGSTDGTAEALSGFGDRITVIRQENRGEAAAKNAAIARARSDFVALLDADDTYLPGRLAALAALARGEPELDILTTDAYLQTEGETVRRVYDETWTFPSGDQRRAILDRNFIFGHAAVRRSAFNGVGGFDERIRRTCDWELWIRMILSGSRAGLVPEPLATYRVHAAALSADRAGMLEGGIETLTRALEHPRILESEREVALSTLRRFRGRLDVIRARDLARSGGPGVRQAAWKVAREPTVPTATRIRSALTLVSPALARWALTRRGEEIARGAGDTRIGARE